MFDVACPPADLSWSARESFVPLPLPLPLQPLCPRCHSWMTYSLDIAWLTCTGCPLIFQLSTAEIAGLDAYYFDRYSPPPLSLPAFLAELALRRFGVLVE